ncbi:unnamed protein product [Lymnaea stagnalis]|uniref:Zinc finger protein 1 n=1 Tax=Lymnaea stagnalis TaxID=6523 RepID=A0AAV2HUM7_LYMST
MRNQHPDKPVRYQCPKCEQTFLLKSHLDKHLAMHSPTSQSCKVCQKTFANVYRLQRHMISHSESTDLRKFKCPECGKAFKFKHHLKEHIRIHSGEKPFQCPTCSKRFSHSGSYSSHMTSKKCWVIGQSKSQARRQERQMEQGRGRESGQSSSNYQGPPEGGQFMFAGVGQVYTQPMTSPPPAHAISNAHTPSQTVSSHVSHTPSQTVSSHVSEGHLKKTPVLVDTLLSAQLRKDIRPLTSSHISDSCLKNPIAIPSPSSPKLSSSVRKRECERDEEESSSSEDISDLIVGEVKLEMNDASDGEVQTCRYCKKQFHSPIDLHQHERYLCEDNHDIKKVMSGCKGKAVSKLETADEQKVKDEVNRCSPLSSKVSDDETEDMEDEDDDEEDDDEEDDDDARSVIRSSKLTENQAQHLRGCYRDNKKPDDHAMEEIAKIIGATKKMVQVWFQSARAREKRKVMRSKPTFKSSCRRNSSGTTTSTSPSTYIPIVPNPYAVFGHHKRYGKFNSTSALSPVGMNFSSIGPLTPLSDEQPLDLSVRKQQPPKAHQQKNSSLLPLENLEGHVLNLSNKVPNLEPVSPKMDAAGLGFQHSEIFKYMSQKGLFKGGFSPLMDPSARKFPPSMLNSSVLAQLTGVIPPNNHHPQRDSPVKTSSADDAPNYESDDNGQSKEGKTAEKVTTFEGELKRFMETQGNLQTLANVASLEEFRALSAAEGKRRRKKSSKQVESEEIKMEYLEDSVSNTDDDSSSPRKRRRSWKGHRISEELGMYACDQCDKQFSKQSSLARHKYEHSGARPFNCEVCSKAFKHKHHLTEHRRLHSGEKPFKCRKCGKRFSHSGSYSQHMNHRYKFCKPSDGEDEDMAAGSSKED